MENLDKERYSPHGEQIYDVETGEIVEIKELSKAITKRMQNSFYENSADILSLGLNVPFRLVKTRNGESMSINIKEDFQFTKVFKTDTRDMMNTTNLSVHAKAFIYTCLPYLYFPTNTVVVDGQNPDIKELCDIVGIGKSKLYEVMDELEDDDIIKKQKLNGKLVIYFNPFLHSCGLIDKYTYKLFEDSQYNPNRQSDVN